MVTGQVPIPTVFFLCSICTYVVRTFDFLESRVFVPQAVGRLAVLIQVMVNIRRMVYRGSAYILLGRWIDANVHMYIEDFAVDYKQYPPFRHVLGEVYPFLSFAPKNMLYEYILKNRRAAVVYTAYSRSAAIF